MKKVLSIVLSLVMVLVALPLSAINSFAETDGDWVYDVENDIARITLYCGSDSVIIIPETLGGYEVKRIVNYAFEDYSALTSITIPYNIDGIGRYAFSGCHDFTICAYYDSYAAEYARDKGINLWCLGPQFVYSINLDETIEIIDTNYFNSSEIEIPSTIDGHTVTSIAKRAFYNNTDIVNVTLPDTLTLIDNAAFFNCYNLESVNIPDGVTKIGRSAFFGCGKLGDIFIPASVTEIVADAFFGCGSMDTITGYLDTAAQEYAEAYDFNFVYLDIITKGDFNTDGTVDILDIGGIMSASTDIIKINNKQRLSGDYNDDGVVDAFDAAAVDRVVA